MLPDQLAQTLSQQISHLWPFFLFWVIFLLLILWSLVWKGIALWQASRRSDRGWFIALLIFNTLGILELIYIFFVANRKEETLTK